MYSMIYVLTCVFILCDYVWQFPNESYKENQEKKIKSKTPDIELVFFYLYIKQMWK